MRIFPENVRSQTLERGDRRLAAASSCPAFDCGSLVLDYRPADSLELGHPQDWDFTCSRCGMEFTVPRGELIFQSIPTRWLSANVGAL
jgi:hypothetical protein